MYFLLEPWIIYDFYNPGLKYGGKIQVKFYGFWFPSLEGDILQSRTIFEQSPKPTIKITDREKQSNKKGLLKKPYSIMMFLHTHLISSFQIIFSTYFTQIAVLVKLLILMLPSTTFCMKIILLFPISMD